MNNLEQQLIESGATLLITSHDRRFLERVAKRWWYVNKGVLEELHDPDLFYRAIFEEKLSAMVNTRAEQSKSNDALSDAVPISDDGLLQRIDELETLLAQDRARKDKFQKPKLQQRWQMELDQLWAKLDEM